MHRISCTETLPNRTFVSNSLVYVHIHNNIYVSHPRPWFRWHPRNPGSPPTLMLLSGRLVTKIVSNMDGSEPQPDDHLSEVEDGAGCTEIWETLSEHRETQAD